MKMKLFFAMLLSIATVIFAMTIMADNSKTKSPQAGDEYNNIKLKEEIKEKNKILPAKVTIDTNKIIKKFSNKMFGYKYDYMTSRLFMTSDLKDGFPVINDNFIDLMKKEKVSMPFVTAAGGGRVTYWKESACPMAERKKTGPYKRKILFGPLEAIKATRRIDPNAGFSFSINMEKGTPAETKQWVEFLTGDKTTKWGNKRIEYGIKEPVKIVVWSLDGEYDWGPEKLRWNVERYVDAAKKHIEAIRSIKPNAVIAIQGATAPWHKRQKKTWRNWNQTILNELGSKVNFIAFHPYYHGHKPAYITKHYMDKMTEDIKNCPNPKVKIYVSEHAMWPPGIGKGGKHWRTQWYQTHALKGCLATSEWLNVMLNRTDVGMMAYHNIKSGPWRMVGRDKESGKFYKTAMLDLYKMYLTVPGENILKTQVSGQYCNPQKVDLSLSVSSIKAKNGDIYVFLSNRLPNTERKVSFYIKGGAYLLDEVWSMSAPDLHSYNKFNSNPVKLSEKKVKKPVRLLSYTVPAKSIVRLKLKKYK
jgi:alpha-L-arabinofuranosidase